MKLHVNTKSLYDVVDLHMIDDSLNERLAIKIGADGNLVGTAIKEGEYIEPFLTMRADMFKEFVLEILRYAHDNEIELDTETAKDAKIALMEDYLEETRGNFKKVLNHILEKK